MLNAAMRDLQRAAWAAVFTAASILVGLSAHAAEIFRIGQSSPANTFLAIWMANDAGIYAAHGLQLEIVPMAGGRDMADAFAARRIDAMHIGLSSVVRANAAGADLRAFASLSNVIRFALFGAPGIKTPADLKGRTIGISSAGSESDVTLTIMLARLGLSRADVTIEEIGARRLDALKSAAVAATAVNEPDRSRAYAAGLPVLIDLAPERIPWLFTGLVATRAALAERRETLARFLTATIEGNHLAIADAARAKAVLKSELGRADDAIVDINYQEFKEQTPVDAEIDRAAAAAVIEQVAKPGASRRLEDYIDLSLSEDLRRRGLSVSATPK